MSNSGAGHTADIYKKLTGKIGLGNSERVMKIWAMVCDEDEAQLVFALPGTLEAVAAKIGKSPDETAAMIGKLYHKGVAFEKVKDGVTTYAPPRNFIQFHDATILWPEAPTAFLDLWKDYIANEYPAFIKMLDDAGMGPFMRIIPINKAIQGGATVLPYEAASNMIGEATKLAVADCPCRSAVRECDAPLDVCIQINRGADYVIKRGTGREITKEEALAVLDRAEKAGLVHLTEHRPGLGNVLCNCCPCCCMALQPLLKGGVRAFAVPSRFSASVDSEACTGCGLCDDRCHADAISGADSCAKVDAERCIGCGLCATVCPADAIKLKEVRA
jgi:NAD-dependent dihydropyrimidine dehydrogenase PreA subunit